MRLQNSWLQNWLMCRICRQISPNDSTIQINSVRWDYLFSNLSAGRSCHKPTNSLQSTSFNSRDSNVNPFEQFGIREIQLVVQNFRFIVPYIATLPSATNNINTLNRLYHMNGLTKELKRTSLDLNLSSCSIGSHQVPCQRNVDYSGYLVIIDQTVDFQCSTQ